jgi:cyclohexanone monooxygenase
MPAPGQQAVITANITLINTEGAAHIAATIKLLEERGVGVFDVKNEAEAEYVEQIVNKYVDASSVMAACTPSRLNFEGNPAAMNPRSGSYGGGRGDFLGFCQMLAEWRSKGDFEGLELDYEAATK